MAEPGERSWEPVIDLSRLDGASAVAVAVRGHHLVIVASAGAVHALAGHCPHDRASLHGGLVRGDLLECPRHRARFRLATGECVSGFVLPALARYPVRVVDGVVEVDAAAVDRDPPGSRAVARWDLTRR